MAIAPMMQASANVHAQSREQSEMEFSRSGFTESGVNLAKDAGLTLIGRAKGKRMIIANGIERVIFDTDTKTIKNDDIISAQRAIIN